jgi:hypothetical protein
MFLLNKAGNNERLHLWGYLHIILDAGRQKNTGDEV